MLIFEHSHPGRHAASVVPKLSEHALEIPNRYLRKHEPCMPEVSELQTVRHYTGLSQKNFSIDTQFYPLGSCSMKYNPRAAHEQASIPEFLSRHPYQHLNQSQGFLSCLYELQDMLKEITGMAGVALSPMAGAQGEYVGVAMIKAYHQARRDSHRTEMLVPDSAHGTNPASAAMCGYHIKEIPTGKDGDLDLGALQAALSDKTAGIMLTNPSTLGLFERKIEQASKMVHDAGGLLYYDGANLNAILGKVRPGDMGFDVMHMNLHKTFATPHGGGGPGCGPVASGKRLVEYLPVPIVGKQGDQYYWLTQEQCPNSIGPVATFAGNAGILLRAYIYIRLLGKTGLHRVAEYATLNANYLMQGLEKLGLELAYPKRRATHEFIVTFKTQAKEMGLTAMDFAKRLLDYGVHAPTTYFPLLVPECWLIEPTETETKETMDRFIEIVNTLLKEAKNDPKTVKTAPHSLPVRRLDEIRAARDLDVKWKNMRDTNPLR